MAEKEMTETKMAKIEASAHIWRTIRNFLGQTEIERRLDRRIALAVSSVSNGNLVAIDFDPKEDEDYELVVELHKTIGYVSRTFGVIGRQTAAWLGTRLKESE